MGWRTEERIGRRRQIEKEGENRWMETKDERRRRGKKVKKGEIRGEKMGKV